MSEQIIKDMLREEKKQRERGTGREVSKKDRGHSRAEIEQIREKEKRKREKERKRREEAREVREARSVPRVMSVATSSLMTSQVTLPENTKQKFMFVFEDTDGMLYSSLSSIIKDEGKKVKIFPVYIAGHTENTSEEEIEYKDGKYVPHEDNQESSWLQILEKVPEDGELVTCDLDDIVVFNNLFYYTLDDFYHYLENSGADYLPVKHAI